MKRILCLTLTLILCAMMAMPGLAAPDAPVITLQPQSPNYPEYSTALYIVKAEGTNLQATWYMEWQGKTYTISKIGGSMQAWEPYAGETYGAMQPDANTFTFHFGGIEADLDGAYIWCVIEDGHYSVTSQKNRISVGNENSPPEIVSIPSAITVEQGEEAEIRCVAKSPDESQLSFLWYETHTGKREDIAAVNRGTETADYLICDTSTPGTRNYICKVETSDGGITYSSVVTVTVVEKQAAPTEPPAPTETTTQTEPPTETPTEAPTEAPTAAPTVTTEATTSETQAPTKPATPNEPQNNSGAPWWLILIAAVLAGGIGFGAAFIIAKKKL